MIRNKSVVFGVIAVIVMSTLAISLPAYTHMLTLVLIMALFATSLNIEAGYAGMLPLGHSMFLGFGAYSFGLLSLKGGIPLTLAFFAALLLSAMFSGVIGYLCLRGKAMSFGLLHLAFNILLFTIATKWISLTGGESGITGIPRPGLFSSSSSFYFFVLAVVLICYVLIKIIMDSPFGKVIQGLRENEERLRFLGINTRRFQLVIFVISGLFAAVAGILLAMLNRGIYTDYLSLIMSVQGVMMCLLGGMSSFLGPSLGAVLVVIFSTVTSAYISQWQALLGVIMIACAISFRMGIIGRGKSKSKLSPAGTDK